MRSLRLFWAIGIWVVGAAVFGAELPPVRIAYFTPSDRQPLPNYQERLDRVMTEVQRFYREGMASAGYGPKTFRLERDAQGKLVLHLVRGQHPMEHYGRNAAGVVRQEVKNALAKQGIEMDRDTWVIFQVLLRWDGNRAVEVGPYCGGGNHRTGTAWVYDDPRLDAKLLSSKSPGGYYGGPCSIGQFNSHYIGGVAHELGHAFGLPHDCQRQADRSRGLSLMGAGNHTYGQELRGEGPSTFLTPACAMLLAYTRPFAGELEGAANTPDCQLDQLDAQFLDGKLVLTGTVTAKPTAFGIAAFNDSIQIPADYDAVSWTCAVGKDGRFRLEIGELRPGPSELRLLVCHTNGTRSTFAFPYQVAQDGTPSLEVFRYRLLLDEAIRAYHRQDAAKAMALAKLLSQRFSHIPEVQRKAAQLQRLLRPSPPQPLSNISAKQGWVSLSGAEFESAQVGWGKPLRDQVLGERPGECFLQVDGQIYEQGLYAHAPSKYQFSLNGQWKQFRTGYGVQDGHDGSVVFVIRGDGRELFRSPLVKDHRLRNVEVDVRGVHRLELCVEDGGDGPNGDWAVWIQPELKK